MQTQKEKTLPTAPIESPLQKKLIVICAAIAAVAIIAGIVFQLVRGHDNFSSVKEKVVTALNEKNSEMLLSMAAKDFVVGQPDADHSDLIELKQILPRIFEISKNTKWSKKVQELGETRIVTPENGQFQLLFSKDGTDWKWSGFYSTNPEDISILLSSDAYTPEKIEYKEIQSETAPDEPTAGSIGNENPPTQNK